MKIEFETEIAIIGAGPAGTTLSIFLAQRGLKHTIFEKEIFPRDKICGDGLSGKVVSVLEQMNPDFLSELEKKMSEFLGSWGVHFAGPNGKGVSIPFKLKGKVVDTPPGYVSKRVHFDNFLFEQLDQQYATILCPSEVTDLDVNEDGVLISYCRNETDHICRAQLVVGAEGDRSLVAKKLAGHQMDPDHYFAGLRVYYKNVSDIKPGNFIELHFLEEVLPGYFWIFPLPDNQVNVGIGMLSRDIKEQKINIKKMLRKAIEQNPQIRARFRDAEPVSDVKGWGLPLASLKRKLSGKRFLLLGDAGSLIDPFTGEGIGNAMFSGQIAADVISEAIKTQNYSADILNRYDRLVYDRIWDEIKLSYRIQKLVKFPWLFNFVINRLKNNTMLMETFSAMFNDLDIRAKLRSPFFYFKLLLNRK